MTPDDLCRAMATFGACGHPLPCPHHPQPVTTPDDLNSPPEEVA